MAIDRRRFLKAGAAQAALAGVAFTACGRHPGGPEVASRENPFQHGVASGDPGTDRVILWTRVSPSTGRTREPIRTDWWVALDAEGSEIVARGQLDALPERDFTVKIDVDLLEPGSDYYYGFSAPGGASPVGRTRTLPRGEVDHIRMAFASCANYPVGFFNVYAAIADRDDLDVVVHLGDYLYEYGNGQYGDGTEIGRIPDPVHEILSLEDYRRRHATYKADPDLQAAHARHPWITVWDDHESANDAWLEGAQNHDPKREGEWSVRRLAAIRAYYEWMPIRELPTGLARRFRFGDLADLIMLDTRLAGRDRQVARDDHDAAWDPDHALLGETQEAWLFEQLSESKRSESSWRVIGQQVVFTPLRGLDNGFNPDAWDGYRATRRRLLEYLESEEIRDVIVLTGDVHSAWAMEVPPGDADDFRRSADAPTSGVVELVAPAVSSPVLGGSEAAVEMFGRVEERLPYVRYKNLDDRGYGILDLTPDRMRAEFFFVPTVKSRTREAPCGAALEKPRGGGRLDRVESGTCAG